MGRAVITPPEISDHDKIKIRVMELFETAGDLKELFNSILPENSLVKTILKINEKQDKVLRAEILSKNQMRLSSATLDEMK